MKYPNLSVTDQEIAALLTNELQRQRNKLELIASENFVSPAVLEAQGSILTNKYAEGYPGRRYYGGCEFIDEIEELAISRAKQLFSAEHVNVQPHSGSQANLAVYFALLKPGDLILGMDLTHGGHLTHGSPVNISGKYFRFAAYGVHSENGLIDYEALQQMAVRLKPRMLVAGASAYPRLIDFARMSKIAKEAGCLLMVDMAHIAGLVAAGLIPSPVPYADLVTTTTHKTLRGPRGGMIVCRKEFASLIDKAVFPGIQGGPLMHVIAAKAVALREALQPEFKAYQQKVLSNAKALAARLQTKGFCLVAQGTDTHMLLIDLRSKGISGQEAETKLDRVGITVNKNTIPYDPASPALTSGIRLGTPAVTSRGMDEAAMREITDIIDLVLTRRDEQSARKSVDALCRKFPLYK